MTFGDALVEVGASAPAFANDMPLAVEDILAMDASTLADDDLIKRIGFLYQLQSLSGLLRTKYLREYRDRHFPITGRVGGKGDVNARAGWPKWLSDTFPGVKVSDANGEIEGLEELERQYAQLPVDVFGTGRPVPKSLPDFSVTVLQELGRANGTRPEVARRLLTGDVPATKRGVRAAVAEEQEKKRLAGIKDIKPAAPKAPVRQASSVNLPMAPPPEGITFSLARYREADETATEMEWYVAHTEKMRKAAVAYRNTCKQLEDRLAKGIADHRHLPAVMTVRQIIWKEREFDLGEAFDAVTKELDEATRLWGLAMPLCNGPAKITE